MHRSLFLFWLFLYASNAVGQIIQWPAPALPTGIQVQGVGDELIVNGIQTKIYQFTVKASVRDFQREFNESTRAAWSWRQIAQGVVRASRREGEFLINLELREQGQHLSGRWFASHLFGVGKVPRTPPPSSLPVGMKLLHQVESFEFDQRSQLFVASAKDPMESVVVSIENALLREGFRQSTEIVNAWQAPDRYFNIYRSGRAEYQITVTKQGTEAVVVMNYLSAIDRMK
jgi:hypothetical protein